MAAVGSSIEELLKEENEVLDLRDRKLNDEDLKKIASMLENNKIVKIIDLGANNLSSEGAKPIIEVLNTTGVTEIIFHNVGFKWKGIKVISESIKNNTTLTRIEFSYNFLSDDDEGANAIAEMLKANQTLKVIDLSHNRINKITKIIAEALKGNQTLAMIDLSDNHIDDIGAQAIANMLEENKTLKVINLQRNYISDAGIAMLSQTVREDLEINLDGQHIQQAPVISLNPFSLLPADSSSSGLNVLPNRSNSPHRGPS